MNDDKNKDAGLMLVFGLIVFVVILFVVSFLNVAMTKEGAFLWPMMFFVIVIFVLLTKGKFD
jgi:lipopolysaccharide export LptBFGC system permease protein LptF